MNPSGVPPAIMNENGMASARTPILMVLVSAIFFKPAFQRLSMGSSGERTTRRSALRRYAT